MLSSRGKSTELILRMTFNSHNPSPFVKFWHGVAEYRACTGTAASSSQATLYSYIRRRPKPQYSRDVYKPGWKLASTLDTDIFWAPKKRSAGL
jgi:hypothetical protein